MTIYVYNVLGVNMELLDVIHISKALSDANRLEIISMLSKKEICGCKLFEKFDITQPTLSHHMKILMDCGLVKERKVGKWHHYSLNKDILMNYTDFLKEIL